MRAHVANLGAGGKTPALWNFEPLTESKVPAVRRAATIIRRARNMTQTMMDGGYIPPAD